jgi:hypothetical protein
MGNEASFAQFRANFVGAKRNLEDFEASHPTQNPMKILLTPNFCYLSTLSWH